MKSIFTLSYRISIKSNLYYNDKVKSFVKAYSQPTTTFINFTNQFKILDQTHSIVKNRIARYLDYLSFVNQFQKINYRKKSIQKIQKELLDQVPRFEIQLAKKIIKLCKQTPFHITSYKIKAIQKLQQDQIFGVFVHRELNLPSKHYNVNTNKYINYTKKQLKVQELKLETQISNRYNKMEGDEFYIGRQNYKKKGFITRSIYGVKLWSVIQLKNQKGKSQEHQSSHLFQLQRLEECRLFDPYFITDFDFLMEGNPYVI